MQTNVLYYLDILCRHVPDAAVDLVYLSFGRPEAHTSANRVSHRRV